MNEWIDELSDLAAAGEAVVLVTIAGIRGSAPREVGAKMIVTAAETIGTIGGGQLEYQCTRIAFDRLNGDETPSIRRSFVIQARDFAPFRDPPSHDGSPRRASIRAMPAARCTESSCRVRLD